MVRDSWKTEFCLTVLQEEETWLEHLHLHTFDTLGLVTFGSNQGETYWIRVRGITRLYWLAACVQAVLWGTFYSSSSFRTCTFFFGVIFEGAAFFLHWHDLKGLAVVLCRQKAPLVLAMQPVMNSILLYLLCALWLVPDVANSATAQNIMCAAQAS